MISGLTNMAGDLVWKYSVFALIALSGFTRLIVFDIDVVGRWREVSAVIYFGTHLFSFGFANFYLQLRPFSSIRFSLINYSIPIFVIFIASMFSLYVFGYFTIIAIGVAAISALDALMQAIMFKYSKLRFLFKVQFVIVIFEIVIIFIIGRAGIDLSREIILTWLSMKNLLLISIVFHTFTYEFSLRSIWSGHLVASRKFLKYNNALIGRSVRLSYFPQIISALFFSFDGLFVSHFLNSGSMGLVALSVFVRSFTILPIVFVAQKFANKLKFIKSDEVVKRQYLTARRGALFVTLGICICIGGLFEVSSGIQAKFPGARSFLYPMLAFSIIFTHLGAVQTILISLKKGRICVLNDIVFLTLCAASIVWLDYQDASDEILFWVYIFWFICAMICKGAILMYVLGVEDKLYHMR